MSENQSTERKNKEFQAEVKQLLDIVINSLYTDREIFLRELISNAADALEKYRYHSLTQEVYQKELENQISIETDEKEFTLSISDTGIGMTEDELINNLGTIAHSGSKAFLQHLAETDKKDLNLIGQFGVGFYSAFMVAQGVRVLTRSYKPEAGGFEWVSQGTGNYSLGPLDNLPRGTKIILHLKEDAREFASPDTIKRIIRQYSSFVPFPILVNGERVNTLQAVWTKNKNEVTPEEYVEFYKYIANAYDEPLYHFHFSADAPLQINSLLFVPRDNFERFGLGKMDPGVNLYCRKVLIQHQAEGILPDWLRFLKGVVDSEEIPLNISRETMQDSSMVAKLRKVITGRFLKFLQEEARNNPEKYAEFWKTFGIFIKEGAVTDYTHRGDLTNLLRYESSLSEPGKFISLADYAGRMQEGQSEIYYINGPGRETLEAGPYLEAFKARNIEVIYTFDTVDDFVFNHLTEYEGKKLVSADQAIPDLPDIQDDKEKLDSASLDSLTRWLKETLGDRISEVRGSKRLLESPAMLVNTDETMTSSMERVMQAMNKDFSMRGSKALEINPGHPLIKGLNELREKDPSFAAMAAEQIYDNALIAAGSATDPRSMVNRMYKILERALK